MGKNEYSLGDFEELVLLSVARLGDTAYGVTILREIMEVGKRFASIGAVYTTLDRMEDKGYISHWMGEPAKEQGGRAKKYYKIEGAGRIALREAQLTRDRLASGVEFLRQGAEGFAT